MQACSIPLLIQPDQADKLIASGSGDAALLYLHILRASGRLEPQKAMEQLQLSPERYKSALETLAQLELIVQPQLPMTPQPEYDAPDISKTIGTEGQFKTLVHDTERRLGKPLSRSDLEKLLYMYDELALPAEVLATLITYSGELFRTRYGQDRSMRMSFVMKLAQEWAELDIRDCTAAENYIKRKKQLMKGTGKVAKLLGISGRNLSASEEKYITAWLQAGFGTAEIEHAYDITVLRTGALTWNYMNAILRNWQKKNLFKLDDILASESSGKKAQAASSTVKVGQDELQAIEHMRKYARKLKENGGDRK